MRIDKFLGERAQVIRSPRDAIQTRNQALSELGRNQATNLKLSSFRNKSGFNLIPPQISLKLLPCITILVNEFYSKLQDACTHHFQYPLALFKIVLQALDVMVHDIEYAGCIKLDLFATENPL